MLRGVIEPDPERNCEFCLQLLQEFSGGIPDASRDLLDLILQKTAFFHQLADDVGNLKDQIEVFTRYWIAAVCMLQVVSSILLHVEP
ncbi:MAG: hypothetical protein ACE5JA_07250, partial [bacterium]